MAADGTNINFQPCIKHLLIKSFRHENKAKKSDDRQKRFWVAQQLDVKSCIIKTSSTRRRLNRLNEQTFTGGGCGSVGRAVASNTRGPRFEYSHWQNLHWTFVYCQLSGMAHLKNIYSQIGGETRTYLTCAVISSANDWVCRSGSLNHLGTEPGVVRSRSPWGLTTHWTGRFLLQQPELKPSKVLKF